MSSDLNYGEDARVISTSIASRSNGEKVIAVQIGFETMIAEPRKEQPSHATINLQIPGVPSGRPAIPLELKATLFFTEKEWGEARDKFVVGDKIKFEFTKKGVELVRC